MNIQITKALDDIGFIAGEYGFDCYEKTALFSKHIDFKYSPVDGELLPMLHVGWVNLYSPFPTPMRTFGMLQNFYSSEGVSKISDDYEANYQKHHVSYKNIEYFCDSGINRIVDWFDKWSSIDWLIGLFEYQRSSKKSSIIDTYRNEGFVSGTFTDSTDSLIFLYAKRGDYSRSLHCLEEYGVSDMQGYEWTVNLEHDLKINNYKDGCPFNYRHLTRAGSFFLENEPFPERLNSFESIASQYHSFKTS